MLTIDDFTEEFKDIAEIIGIEVVYKLCDIYGGLSIYIPKNRQLNNKDSS
ncbi:Mor transcription activator family protein [uncultured Brachyspira sp.]